MQRKRMQMALVADEYGGISGFVTTEDLLEELVGEIEDEHDVGDLRRAEQLEDGSILVDGQISLNDLEEELEIKFQEGLPYDTLSGLILKELGRFPKQGKKITCNEFVMACEQVTPTTIVKIKIIKAITKE